MLQCPARKLNLFDQLNQRELNSYSVCRAEGQMLQSEEGAGCDLVHMELFSIVDLMMIDFEGGECELVGAPQPGGGITCVGKQLRWFQRYHSQWV